MQQRKVCKICACEHDGETYQSKEKKYNYCIISNTKYKTQRNTEHSATDKNCSSYKRQLDIISSKIN